MKFAKELERELVPEWRAKYLDYRQAKKKLKTLERALNRLDRTPRSPRRLGTFLNPTREHFSPRSPLHHQHAEPPGLSRTPKDGGALPSDENGSVNTDTSRQRRAVGVPTIFRETSSERQPLNPSEGKAPARSRPIGLTRYGSIIGSPPFRSVDPHVVRPQPPPGRPPTLELPDAALSPEEAASVAEEANRIRFSSATAEGLSAPRNSDAVESSQAKHFGQGHRAHMSRALRRARSAPRFESSRPLIKRMFSLTGRHSGAPSPRGYDLPLENYREVELRQGEFFRFLDLELEKIEAFYEAKENEANDRLISLREQLHILRNRRLEDLEAAEEVKKRSRRKQSEDDVLLVFSPPPDAATADSSSKPGVSWAEPISSAWKVARRGHIGTASKALASFRSQEDEAVNQQPLDQRRDYSRRPERPDVPYRTAKRKLKVAMQEYYRGLELLKSYALLNRTAFRKINKKYDKTVHARPQLRYMAEKVNEAWFVQSETVDAHIRSVEDLYARYFEKGNHKVAVGKLRVKTSRQGAYSGSSFRNGLTAAAGAVLGIEGVVTAGNLLFRSDATIAANTSFLLQLYGGYALMLLLLLMFCLNCKVWHATKINYVFVFEFDTRHHLDWRQLCELPCFCVFLLGFFMWLNFGRHGTGALFLYYPVILIGVTLAIICFPARVLYHRTRQWFLYSHWRLLLAGIYPVEFRDFFLGDMFCSLTYSMGGIEVFFCLYANDWRTPVQCTSSRSRLLGFLSTLPGIWRALQCLRRYSDTRNVFPHLVNCGKYGFTILYYVSLSMWRIDHQNYHLKAVFIFCAVVNSIYCSIWDLVMDWSLGDPYAPNAFLRNVLGYKNVWIYYTAMLIDPLLRFNWIFYVIFSQETQHSALLSFLVSFSEVLRRSMWTLFRVENEHCTNVCRFRASRDVPLPYEVALDARLPTSPTLIKTQSSTLAKPDHHHRVPAADAAGSRLASSPEVQGLQSMPAAALSGSPASIHTAGPSVAASFTTGAIAPMPSAASGVSATTSGIDIARQSSRPSASSGGGATATTGIAAADGPTRRRRWSSARSTSGGAPPVLIQELSRVGTLLHAAHAEDFERRKRPEMESSVDPEDLNISSDDDDEEEETVGVGIVERGKGLVAEGRSEALGGAEASRGRTGTGESRRREENSTFRGGSPV